ncbi:MAG: amidohydrolase family protein [Myxococcota bacterium]|jgi:predicted TIM-barrel fold metal-dependent hydrolase
MTNVLKEMDRYLLITSDSHAGPEHRTYGNYLEQKWQGDFNDWAKEVDEWIVQMRTVMGPRSIAVNGDPEVDGGRNWDSTRRLAETEADGVVAEVIFSNTSPPFAPRLFTEFGEPEIGRDFDRRWAGIQAHNRWLADFCSEAPGRRAGIVQIYLPNVEGSVKEIRWAKENGLTGGVLLPGAPPGSGVPPLYAPEYEPIWNACDELDMPLNHHAGAAVPDFGQYLPQSLTMYMLEVKWWAHRALWHLMFSGVFERHPSLQFVLTEVGAGWAPEVLRELNHFYNQMKNETETSEHIFGGPAVSKLSLTPTEYFDRQVHLGASFLAPLDCEKRHEIGVHKLMWGSDYPHTEGSYPFSREHLRLTLAGVPEEEVHMMLATNAAKVYGFDIDALAKIAAKVGPTKEEISTPLDLSTLPNEARKCPAFGAGNQRGAGL